MLYWGHSDQGAYLHTSDGVRALDPIPYVASVENGDGGVPVCVHAQLLHAWRHVPHDGSQLPQRVEIIEGKAGGAISFRCWLFLLAL